MGVAAAVAGISGVASIASGVIGAGAANQAASDQANAAENSLNAQINAENVATGNLAPFVDVGTGAIHSLADLYGISYAPQGTGQQSVVRSGVITPANSNAVKGSPGGQGVQNAAYLAFTKSPDYAFAFNQGLQALDRSAAAGGSLLSGGQAKAATEFGQGLASQQFGNYFNRLLSLGQMGQNAAAGQATNSLNAANSQANSLQALGQAQASGAVGSANAITGALNGLGSTATQSLLLSKLGNSSLSAYSNPMTAYNNSTGNYAGLSDVGQDTLQDSGYALP